MNNEEKAYLYWLHQVPGIGNQAILRLMQEFGSAREVYEAPEKKLLKVIDPNKAEALLQTKKKWDVKNAYEKLQGKGICLISKEDAAYPQKLRKMERAPYLLYVIGGLPKENTFSIAIIGARECSGYGELMARAFATGLSAAGVNIISGMARGIDGISQEAAVEAGGNTYAVLGCGVDVCYPPSNRKLYENIKQRGGILSPYPPGTQPQKTFFPYRNQIVAGLSDALLVIEARQKSGTWITVDSALEQGKDVYAVPGRLTDRLSDGCNLLIRQGAGIALSPEDMLAELKVLKNRQEKRNTGCGKEDRTERGKEKRKEEPPNIPEETGVLKWLDFYPQSVDEILEAIQKEDAGITLSQLMFELIQLCMQGKAEQTCGNYFMKVR